MPGMPEEPGPNPQSCDTDCSQSQEWGHQVQEAQKGHPGVFHNFSIVDLPLVKSVDGLSVISLQGIHCILTQ